MSARQFLTRLAEPNSEPLRSAVAHKDSESRAKAAKRLRRDAATALSQLPPCDCLNDCGDDERVKQGVVAACPHAQRRAAAAADAAELASRTEQLVWTRVATGLPDDATTVHVQLVNDSEPTWLGYYDSLDGLWMSIDQSTFAGTVVAWAPMAKGVAC